MILQHLNICPAMVLWQCV